MKNKINEINIAKVPLKYLLNVYSFYETYPNKTDLLYEICSDKSIIEGLEFDYNYLKYIISFKTTKKDIKPLLNDLIENNFLSEDKKGRKFFYKLLINPWS